MMKVEDQNFRGIRISSYEAACLARGIVSGGREGKTGLRTFVYGFVKTRSQDGDSFRVTMTTCSDRLHQHESRHARMW